MAGIMSSMASPNIGKQDTGLSPANSRWAHNKAFIQQTAAPEWYQTMPPSTNHPSAVYKKVTIDNSFTVPVLPTNALKQVDPGTGLILWFPKLGVDTIIHQGIIPQHTVMTRQIGTMGYDPTTVTLTINSLSNSDQVTDSPGAGQLITGVSGFVFTRALGVPRLDAVIKVTPKIEDSFSSTRVYGGQIGIRSDTIASGNLNLTGIASAAVIADTRDICQNKEGTDAYSWGDLNQAARTWKESTKEVTISDGVITIQGSDIPPDFGAPDSLNDVKCNGGWSQPYQYPEIIQPNCNFNKGPQANTGAQVQVPIMSAWYSPYGVNQMEGFGNNTAQGTTPYAFTAGILPNDAIALPTLAETSTVKVKFEGLLSCYNPNLINLDANEFRLAFDVVVEHFFAGISNSYNQNPSFPIVGTANVRSLRTVHTYHGTLVNFLGNPANTAATSQLSTQSPVSLSHISDIDDQYIGQGGASAFGKFIGCKIYVCCRAYAVPNGDTCTFTAQLFSYGPNVRNAGTVDLPSAYGDVIEGPQISFFSQEINEPGACGPCHIIRYDAVGPGQQVRINGMLNTESVAKGSLAPYVQDQVMNARIASDVNVLPLIWMLYNGNSEFKMSWVQSEYEAWRLTKIRHMSAESLNDLADGDSRVQTAMEAAGLFQGIIGGLGHAVGGALDGIIGAAGQFGASARGQFGASGQFGDTPYNTAAGSFGGMRRSRTM